MFGSLTKNRHEKRKPGRTTVVSHTRAGVVPPQVGTGYVPHPGIDEKCHRAPRPEVRLQPLTHHRPDGGSLSARV